MAIYYFDMQNLKKGYGKSHSNYINGTEEYSYKANEVLYKKEVLPKFAKDSNDFWAKHDKYERVNARLGKKIKISLPKELSNEENIELLNRFLEKELGNKYYYTAVIHDKESSEKGTQNIHAHIIICPRLRDGIERSEKTFFKRFNSKNVAKGGAKKDPYWNEYNTLLGLRHSWENTLNENLLKKNISLVSCESLKKQREKALEQGNIELAESLNRDPVSIKGYILRKDINDLNENEKTELEIYEKTKELKSCCELIYNLNCELKELKEKEKEIAASTDFVFTKVESFSIADKEYKNLYDIEENILMLEIEERNALQMLENDPNNNVYKDKLHSIKIRKEEYKNIMDEEISKLSKNEDFTKVYTEFNSLYFSTDLKRYWYNLRKIEFNNNKINEFQDKLNNIDDTVFNVISKGKYSKTLSQIKGLQQRLKVWDDKLDNLTNSENPISEEQLDLINNKIDDITLKLKSKREELSTIKSDCLAHPKFDKIREKIIAKYRFLIDEIDKENNIRQTQNMVLRDKCDFSKQGNNLFDTLRICQKQITSLDSKIDFNNLKIKSLKNKLDYQLKFGIYDTLTDGKYSKILSDTENINKNISTLKQELEATSKMNIFKQMQLKEQISKLELNKNDLELDFKNILSKITKQDFNNLATKLTNDYNKDVKQLKEQNYNFEVEKYALIFASNSIKKEIYPLTKRKGGGCSSLNDFISKYRANLGIVQNTGINFNNIDKDDKLAIQMKKELDFF